MVYIQTLEGRILLLEGFLRKVVFSRISTLQTQAVLFAANLDLGLPFAIEISSAQTDRQKEGQSTRNVYRTTSFFSNVMFSSRLQRRDVFCCPPRRKETYVAHVCQAFFIFPLHTSMLLVSEGGIQRGAGMSKCVPLPLCRCIPACLS